MSYAYWEDPILYSQNTVLAPHITVHKCEKLNVYWAPWHFSLQLQKDTVYAGPIYHYISYA